MSRIYVSYDTREPDVWVLDRPYERMTAIGPVVVPQGFKTDLASTPNVVWRMFPKLGPWTGAAIIHDYLYREKPGDVSRYEADRIFYQLLREDGVLHGIARIMYRAVREFGENAWRRHQKSLGGVTL